MVEGRQHPAPGCGRPSSSRIPQPLDRSVPAAPAAAPTDFRCLAAARAVASIGYIEGRLGSTIGTACTIRERRTALPRSDAVSWNDIAEAVASGSDPGRNRVNGPSILLGRKRASGFAEPKAQRRATAPKSGRGARQYDGEARRPGTGGPVASASEAVVTGQRLVLTEAQTLRPRPCQSSGNQAPWLIGPIWQQCHWQMTLYRS